MEYVIGVLVVLVIVSLVFAFMAETSVRRNQAKAQKNAQDQLLASTQRIRDDLTKLRVTVPDPLKVTTDSDVSKAIRQSLLKIRKVLVAQVAADLKTAQALVGAQYAIDSVTFVNHVLSELGPNYDYLPSAIRNHLERYLVQDLSLSQASDLLTRLDAALLGSTDRVANTALHQLKAQVEQTIVDATSLDSDTVSQEELINAKAAFVQARLSSQSLSELGLVLLDIRDSTDFDAWYAEHKDDFDTRDLDERYLSEEITVLFKEQVLAGKPAQLAMLIRIFKDHDPEVLSLIRDQVIDHIRSFAVGNDLTQLRGLLTVWIEIGHTRLATIFEAAQFEALKRLESYTWDLILKS
ncbi:hypothetical protein [Aquirhabdus sp.]|uniref:hypothetical protein n=1 Tax=Aquirhabdus sp. TaxID=2824160 RepID=UPI00396CFA96